MRLDEIAKMAIDEVSAELKSIQSLDEKKAFEITETSHKSQITQPANEMPTNNNEEILSEEIFLKNLKERLEVLFEGLCEMPKDKLENRLDITLKFLEFALANVENRLSNIKK